MDLDFLNNFLYPAGLIVVGGLVTGVLVPIYTWKQKKRQIDVEQERSDNDFRIKTKQQLLNEFLSYLDASFSTFSHIEKKTMEYVRRTPDGSNPLFPEDIVNHYKQAVEKSYKTTYHINQLNTLVKWYDIVRLEDKEKEPKKEHITEANLQDLQNAGISFYQSFQKLMSSTTKMELEENYRLLIYTREKFADLLDEIEGKLISIKVRVPSPKN